MKRRQLCSGSVGELPFEENRANLALTTLLIDLTLKNGESTSLCFECRLETAYDHDFSSSTIVVFRFVLASMVRAMIP